MSNRLITEYRKQYQLKLQKRIKFINRKLTERQHRAGTKFKLKYGIGDEPEPSQGKMPLF